MPRPTVYEYRVRAECLFYSVQSVLILAGQSNPGSDPPNPSNQDSISKLAYHHLRSLESWPHSLSHKAGETVKVFYQSPSPIVDWCARSLWCAPHWRVLPDQDAN